MAFPCHYLSAAPGALTFTAKEMIPSRSHTLRSRQNQIWVEVDFSSKNQNIKAQECPYILLLETEALSPGPFWIMWYGGD